MATATNWSAKLNWRLPLFVLALSTAAWLHYSSLVFTDRELDELRYTRHWVLARIYENNPEDLHHAPMVSGWLSKNRLVASQFARDMAARNHRLITLAGQVWVEWTGERQFALVVFERGITSMSPVHFDGTGEVAKGGNVLDRRMRVEGWLAAGAAGISTASLLWLLGHLAIRRWRLRHLQAFARATTDTGVATTTAVTITDLPPHS